MNMFNLKGKNFFSQKSESYSIFLIKIPSKYGIVKIVIQKNQISKISVILYKKGGQTL